MYDYGESPLIPPVPDGSPPPAPEDLDEIAYLVMELVPGEALSATLSRDGALGTDRTLDLVAQAARALHAAHLRGVVHRDVKPANLMVTPDRRVKITDFGIARPQDHEPLTATGQVMGTAHYLAPELARGQAATSLSDVYALGVVAYECLAGRRPFEGDNQVAVATAHLSEPPPPLPETLSPEVRRIVEAAMEKDPNRRFQGADTFAAALEGARYRLLAGQPPAADVYLGTPVNPPAELGGGSGAAIRAGGPGRRGRGGGEGPRTAGATPVTAPLPLGGRRGGSATPKDGTGSHNGVAGHRRRRVLTGPLMALVGLLVVIAVGAVINAWSQKSPPPDPKPVSVPTSATSRPPSPVVVPLTRTPTPFTPVRPSTTRPTTTPSPTTSPTTTPTPTTSPTATPTPTTSPTATTSPTTTAPATTGP